MKIGNLDFGFTLAEILIALTIIGVVSAVTVPVLMQNTNKQEYVTALKKTYSTLSQAANMIIAENGPVTAWGLTDDQAGREKIYKLFMEKLNHAKDCKNSTDGDCFAKTSYTMLNKGAISWGNLNTLSAAHHKMVLSDGVSVFFDNDISSTCTGSWNNESNLCLILFVDVNGAKKPNRFGRDTFQFNLADNGIKPAGCQSNSRNCTASGNGFDCACRVLRDNAMNY